MISLKEPSNEPVAVNGENRDKGKDYKVSIPEAPRTGKRRPYVPSKQSKLVDAGTARATIGASNEAPQGTTKDNWAGRHQDQTVLQQQCEYFDRDRDGVIWPIDTWRGFRDWAFFWPLAAFGTFIIHLALSYPTSPSLLPDPCFGIYLNNVHRNKHGSDIITGLRGQAFAFDFFGCSAAVLEWRVLEQNACLNFVNTEITDCRCAGSQPISCSGLTTEFCRKMACDAFSTAVSFSKKLSSTPELQAIAT